MSESVHRILLSGGVAALLAGATGQPFPAIAQEDAPIVLPEIVVTATRTPVSPRRVGSAITVLTAEDLAATRSAHLAEALRRVPGVTVTQTGGVGATTDLRIRGAEPGHTLVLIDGVRVNDPSSVGGEFDFAGLLVTDIERVEILRGPQSALYGSDAIGGVVNIITKRGRGPLAATALAEYGSYDTFRQAASVSGGTDRFDYALSLAHLTTDGFSRLDEDAGGREKDGAENLAGAARLGYRFADWLRSDLSFTVQDLDADTDPSFSPPRDGFREADRTVYAGRLAQTAALLDGRLENILSLSAARTERTDRETASTSSFESNRYGVEYQGNLTLTEGNVLTLGVRHETEEAAAEDRGAAGTRFDDAVETASVYGQYQIGLFDSLFLTAGMRLDDYELAGGFVTYRFTGAYIVEATDTTLRGSVGSGAKAPTLFQLFDTRFGGNPDLQPERSIGYDFGVDQALLDDRLRLSATWFHNDIENLIAFDFAANGGRGAFVNVAAAETEGLELAAIWAPLPTLLLRGSYTALRAIDKADGTDLARRPRDSASLSVDYSGIDRTRLGAALVYVGERFSRSRERDPLDDYVRVDLNAGYDLSDRIEIFARIENLFDEDYEEVFNAGTAGLSAYVGARARF